MKELHITIENKSSNVRKSHEFNKVPMGFNAETKDTNLMMLHIFTKLMGKSEAQKQMLASQMEVQSEDLARTGAAPEAKNSGREQKPR